MYYWNLTSLHQNGTERENIDNGNVLSARISVRGTGCMLVLTKKERNKRSVNHSVQMEGREWQLWRCKSAVGLHNRMLSGIRVLILTSTNGLWETAGRTSASTLFCLCLGNLFHYLRFSYFFLHQHSTSLPN